MADPGHSEFVKILDGNGDVISSFGGTVVSQDDNSAFTVNTSEGAPLFGLYEASPSSLTDGRVGVIGVNSTRAVRTVSEAAVASSFDHGSNRDVGTSAEQITSTSIAAKFGVLVRADPANTGVVYVGNADVTAGTTDATDGMPLQAGESLLVKVDNANKVYVIGSAANQIVYFMVV